MWPDYVKKILIHVWYKLSDSTGNNYFPKEKVQHEYRYSSNRNQSIKFTAWVKFQLPWEKGNEILGNWQANHKVFRMVILFFRKFASIANLTVHKVEHSISHDRKKICKDKYS